MNKKILLGMTIIIFVIFGGFVVKQKTNTTAIEEKVIDPCIEYIERVRAKENNEDLVEKYKDLLIIDSHNHDATSYQKMSAIWNKYYIDKIAVSGYVARKNSILTDQLTWEAYQEYPDQIYPFFGGFDPYSTDSLKMIKEQLEKGYVGIGELAAPSHNSSTVSNSEWKAENAMDGILPEVYKLAGEYKVPVLLHIDPPHGSSIEVLEQAANQYPETTFIFGHANAFNDPESLINLASNHPNIILDIFAGFTAYNQASGLALSDFSALIEKFPNQVVMSTDSGYGIEYEEAILAMYELIDILKPETACKVSHQNFQKLMEGQKSTENQINLIDDYANQLKREVKQPTSKLEANKMIFSLEKELDLDRKPFNMKEFSPKEVGESKQKTFNELNEMDMVAISRDLIEKLQRGMYSEEIEDLNYEELHSTIYFEGAILEKYKMGRATSPYLHKYRYHNLTFSNEIVSMNEDDFMYEGDLYEYVTSLETNERTTDVSRFKIWVAYDKETNSYKIKDELAVGIQVKD
ncbi:amidohydrolase family protein [Bacillus sp. CGMCC 1.16607]|uniref:amidohydrolase family protein n=1 Tax=Bacillus sp. CGMCC 1.16607 TaxID=3351842 RepID=UPI00362B15BE